MGSEQSSQNGERGKDKPSRAYRLRSEKTMPAAADVHLEDNNGRSISPELSVCSDSDLPYISYTVNRPIGDSPKLPTKHLTGLQRGKSLGSSISTSPIRNRRVSSSRKPSGDIKTGHNIVVVKPGKEPEKQEKDAHLQRLQNIPMFLPIMRGTLNLPGTRDPEVLEKLDPQDFLALCKKLQSYMGMCAETVSSSQNEITGKVREVDFELCRLVTTVGERNKQISKAAERLSKVSELSRQLSRCHDQLNSVLELMEMLNNDLPIDSRLEPFVWTTG